MNKEQVIELMESSTSAEAWDNNADKVKEAFGGDYPGFWWETIIKSDRARRILAKFGASPDITITPI